MLIRLSEEYNEIIDYALPNMVNRSLIFKYGNRIKYYPIQFMNDNMIIYEGNYIDYDSVELDIRYYQDCMLETKTNEITRFILDITEEYNYPKYTMKFIHLDTKLMKRNNIDLFKKFHKMIANPKRKLSENLCIYNIKDVKVNSQCIYEIIYFMDDKLIYEEYNNPIFNLMVDDNIIQLNDYLV